MTIIEKGLSPNFFKGGNHYLPFILTLGIISIGISMGIAFGTFLNSLEIGGTEYLMLPFAIFLFLGMSLLVSYFILKSIRKKQ